MMGPLRSHNGSRLGKEFQKEVRKAMKIWENYMKEKSNKNSET